MHVLRANASVSVNRGASMAGENVPVENGNVNGRMQGGLSANAGANVCDHQHVRANVSGRVHYAVVQQEKGRPGQNESDYRHVSVNGHENGNDHPELISVWSASLTK